jgi:putative transposase
MTDYRRNRVPGGTYFFTVNLLDRTSDLLTRHIISLRTAVSDVREKAPFHIDAWVVLPDHMHCLWTLPEGDADFSSRWRAIKTNLSRQLPTNEPRSSSRMAKGERGIWQRRFWEHTIRDEHDYATHMDYVHFNPVKHALVPEPADWPYSSFHRCVERGFYPKNWQPSVDPAFAIGERAAPTSNRSAP